MIQSRAAWLAFAASLDANAAAFSAIAAEMSAKAAAIRAWLDATENQAPTATVTLEEHMRRTGQHKRKSREIFAAFERAGFRVVRLGHSVSMDADEYARAVEAFAAKRAPAPRAAALPDHDESPVAIFAQSALVPTRPPKAAPRKRAA